MNFVEPESLKMWQLDIKAREIAKEITGDDFDNCSEDVKFRSLELAIKVQEATMIANIAASIQEKSE